ncbi:hypothetical protein [Paenibacillus ferrarius]|nr:hypothetical protein [Paenibacillus ferrarius]
MMMMMMMTVLLLLMLLVVVEIEVAVGLSHRCIRICTERVPTNITKYLQNYHPRLTYFEKPAEVQAFSTKSGENMRKPAIVQAF